MSTRRWARTVAALAGLAVTASCAGIPIDGRVQTGRVVEAGGVGEGPPVVTIFGAAPTPGMTPRELVRGFLRAEVGSLSGTSVVASYLASSAAAHWHPTAAPVLTVYDDNRSRLMRTHDGVDLVARVVGTLQTDGQWRSSAKTLRVPFHLVRESGQWRIAQPPSPFLVDQTDVSTAYREVQLTYLDPRDGTAVPLPAVEPRFGSGLGTTLVKSLLAGPPQQLAGAVVSAIPKGTDLPSNVVITNDRAEVNLSEPIRGLPPARLRQATQQLRLTLDQLPGVGDVRLLADGAPIALPTTPSKRAALPARPAVPLTLVSRAGTVQRYAAPLRVARAWRGVSAAALDNTGDLLAARGRPGHESLLVGEVRSRPRRVLHGDSIDPVGWSHGRGLAVVDGSRLVAVAPGGRHVAVRLPAPLPARGIRALSIAPDGVSVALLVGAPGRARLQTAALTPDDRLVGLTPIALPQRQLSAVSWQSDNAIVVLAEDGRSLVTTDPAGFAQHRLSLPAGPPATVLCAAPDGAIATLAGGRLQVRSRGGWVAAGPAANCA